MLGQLITAFLPRLRADTTVETLGHPAAGVVGWFDTSTSGGVTVTKDTALTFSAVWCANRVISETLATLPCILYRRLEEDERERASEDPRYFLVHDEPHPAYAPVAFYETMTSDAVMTGNAFARILRSQGQDSLRLEYQSPTNVRCELYGDELFYYLIAEDLEVPAADMIHVHGIGGDALKGWSVVKYARESIAGALAADMRSSKQQTTGAMPGGVLVVPTRLSKEAREHMRKEWNEIHEGADKANRIGILHGGIDYKPLAMSNEDAQFLESRQFSVREIARWFRLPPHMLGDLQDSSVRANIEQQAIEFIQYSMMPWIVRWQQELNRKLLMKEERRELYFEFLLESLLRGDVMMRYNAYAVARQWGWLSVNDIRRAENMNSIEDGDIYLQPSNMVEAGTPPPQPAAPGTQPGQMRDDDMPMEEKRDDAAEALEMIRKESLLMFRSRLACLVRIECAEVSKAAVRMESRGENFLEWLESWYSAYPWQKQSIEDKEFQHAWEAESKRLLLATTDGPAEGFSDRVQDTLRTFAERVKTAEPTKGL